MRIVAVQEFEGWLANGKVLEKDARGPKVVAMENGLFLKIFHTRRHPLLAKLSTPAKTFQQNAAMLAEIGIPRPEIVEIFWLKKDTDKLSACLYQPLPGVSIETLITKEPEAIDGIIPELAKFIAKLHAAGIYFRSLHLGNIIYLPEGKFGLIDFLDMKNKRRPLRRNEINRNFNHLESSLNRRQLCHFPLDSLKNNYENIRG